MLFISTIFPRRYNINRGNAIITTLPLIIALFTFNFHFILRNNYYIVIPNSSGLNLGHTLSLVLITEADSLVPISQDSLRVLP